MLLWHGPIPNAAAVEQFLRKRVACNSGAGKRRDSNAFESVSGHRTPGRPESQRMAALCARERPQCNDGFFDVENRRDFGRGLLNRIGFRAQSVCWLGLVCRLKTDRCWMRVHFRIFRAMNAGKTCQKLERLSIQPFRASTTTRSPRSRRCFCVRLDTRASACAASLVQKAPCKACLYPERLR